MEKRLLKIGEVSEYLGVSVNTLRCWCSRRTIPYVKLGRMVRFDIAQLETLIKDNLVETQDYDNILEPGLNRKRVLGGRDLTNTSI